jgi:hypothetical protein
MIAPPGTLSASVQALTLARGLHLVCVTAAAPQRVGDDAGLTLPAIHVGVAPGVPQDRVEILGGPRNTGCWLCEVRDMLVIKVVSGHAVVLLTTVRAGAPEGMVQGAIAVEVSRLDGKPSAPAAWAPGGVPATSPKTLALAPPTVVAPNLLGTVLAGGPPEPSARLAVAPVPATLNTPSGRSSLSTRVDLHIARKGDVAYVNNYWAGALGERLPIEAFAISPLEGLRPDQLEYSALATSGGESGWIEGGRLCGSRGTAVALAGFAVRLKGDAAAEYECEYRGSFSSGRIVGPVRDGALCASDAGDRLEAIQIFLLRRETAEATTPKIAALPDADDPAPPASPARPIGPRFSVFRESVE